MGNRPNIYRFEIQHIFPKALWRDPDLAVFLESIGIFEEMRGNKVALFAEQDTLDKFKSK